MWRDRLGNVANMFACRMKHFQYLLYGFNILFAILGLVILVIGIWAKSGIADMGSLMSSNVIRNAAIMLITAGAFVLLISALGFYATRKQHRKLLISFACSISIIFVLELAGGLYVFTSKENIVQRLHSGIRQTVMNEYGGNMPDQKSRAAAVDWIQKNVGCCGIYSPDDWEGSKWYKHKFHEEGVRVPTSCCKYVEDTCNKGSSVRKIRNDGQIYYEGCNERAEMYVKKYFRAVGRIGIAIAFFQLIGIVLVCCLYSQTRKEAKQVTSAVESLLVKAPIVHPPHLTKQPDVFSGHRGSCF